MRWNHVIRALYTNSELRFIKMVSEQAQRVMIALFLRKTAAPDTVAHGPVLPAPQHPRKPPPGGGSGSCHCFKSRSPPTSYLKGDPMVASSPAVAKGQLF